MDATPYDFRERVAALWKCCVDGIHDPRCDALRALDCEWTREMTRVSLLINCERAQWKYGFNVPTDTGSYLSLEQLQKRFKLEHVTIEVINVFAWDLLEDDNLTNLCGDDVERLMKLIVYLSNEPLLGLFIITAGGLSTPIGSTLLRCLSNIHFSKIELWDGPPVCNQLLGNQFSRRTPSFIVLRRFDQNRKFFQKNLKNGRIKRFYTHDNNGDYRFPAEVMEGIINSFLKNPERYDERYFRISAQFDESTEAWLKRKLKDRTCERDANGEYCFTAYNSKLRRRQRLSVEKHEKSRFVCMLGTY